MPVSDIMTANPVTVGPDDTLAQAQRLLDRYPIHHLLVVEEERVIGVLSEGDILRNVSPYANTPAETERDAFTLKRKVHQVMRRRPAVVRDTAPIKDAAALILESGLTCVPVVDQAQKLIGIVSWKDLLRFALR